MKNIQTAILFVLFEKYHIVAIVKINAEIIISACGSEDIYFPIKRWRT